MNYIQINEKLWFSLNAPYSYKIKDENDRIKEFLIVKMELYREDIDIGEGRTTPLSNDEEMILHYRNTKSIKLVGITIFREENKLLFSTTRINNLIHQNIQNMRCINSIRDISELLKYWHNQLRILNRYGYGFKTEALREMQERADREQSFYTYVGGHRHAGFSNDRFLIDETAGRRIDEAFRRTFLGEPIRVHTPESIDSQQLEGTVQQLRDNLRESINNAVNSMLACPPSDDRESLLRASSNHLRNDMGYGNLFAPYTSLPNNAERKYIHPYNYKPEYIKHFMPGEDESTTLLLGAEIEVDCGGKSEEHAKKGLGIICGINDDKYYTSKEDKMYCTADGSLIAGIEFDTMPCSLEYHKTQMRYKELFEYLDSNGYKAHDTNTCGLHIHANRGYLGNTVIKQELVISKILYILEKFNDEICVIARRSMQYSKFLGAGANEKSVVELYGKYKSSDKYAALNLQHPETIEFRHFKGTLKHTTLLLTMEFVKNIIDYAKSISIEEVEQIKWDDLYNTFSDELKEYYQERLRKQKDKN